MGTNFTHLLVGDKKEVKGRIGDKRERKVTETDG